VFQDGDDEKRGFAAEVDAFDGVRVAGFLEQGEEAFGDILDVFGFNGFEDIDGNEIPQELDEQFVITEDEFEAVVFGVVNRHEGASLKSGIRKRTAGKKAPVVISGRKGRL
jgi:hypothetical protein